MKRTSSVHRFPFTLRDPFSVFHNQWLTANGKRLVNGKWLMVNEASEGGV